MMRDMVSPSPAGGKGTTSRIGRLGQADEGSILLWVLPVGALLEFGLGSALASIANRMRLIGKTPANKRAFRQKCLKTCAKWRVLIFNCMRICAEFEMRQSRAEVWPDPVATRPRLIRMLTAATASAATPADVFASLRLHRVPHQHHAYNFLCLLPRSPFCSCRILR